MNTTNIPSSPPSSPPVPKSIVTGQASQQPPSIIHISKDLLALHILEHLPKKDLGKVALVSKQFLNAVKHLLIVRPPQPKAIDPATGYGPHYRENTNNLNRALRQNGMYSHLRCFPG